MMLTELTTVPPEALPVEGFKNHLRLGSGFTDDGLQDEVLDSFLRAAIAAIEARTGKILVARDFAWDIHSWRDACRQPVPLAPVISINQMVLRRDSDEDSLIPAERYALEPDLQRPVLIAPRGSLPSIPHGGSVQIELTAGFAADWDGIPADLKQAVFMLAAHFYEYRHEAALNGSTMPYGVSALIERYRTVRLFVGGGT